MNSRPVQLSHEQVALLLPAFIHGKLDSGQQRQVQEHIAACPACGAAHRSDLELVDVMTQPPPELEALLTSARRTSNRRQLYRSIGNRGAVQGEAGIRPRAGISAAVYGPLIGVAAVLFVSVVSLGRWTIFQPSPAPVIYQTRSDIPPDPVIADGTVFRVVLGSTLKQQAVGRLMHELGASVVDGPSAEGIFTIAFPGDERSPAEILADLRTRPEVVLAEQAVHSDF